MVDRLHRIRAKTLVMAAREDTMSPDEMHRAAELIPNARIHVSENGTHMAMFDDQEDYFTALLSFLDEQ